MSIEEESGDEENSEDIFSDEEDKKQHLEKVFDFFNSIRSIKKINYFQNRLCLRLFLSCKTPLCHIMTNQK